MDLSLIYRPIARDLRLMDQALSRTLKSSRSKSISRISGYLLDSPGKRIRPALVIFSARAVSGREPLAFRHQLIKLASAIELIHTASLIHDDVVDHSTLRHNKPTVNCKWNQDVSIALGDYLYAKAFELISSCGNSLLSCISQATRLMCEGELRQICERDNLNLLKERYLLMVKHKTASLFVASCQSGALLSNGQRSVQNALKEYGLNFGMAFQIADDCLDLIGREKELGKAPGADFKMGELTLPVLNLLSESKDKNRVLSLIRQRDNAGAFRELRQRFIDSSASLKTKSDILFYVRKAKNSLDRLAGSSFKRGLFDLADFIGDRYGTTQNP